MSKTPLDGFIPHRLHVVAEPSEVSVVEIDGPDFKVSKAQELADARKVKLKSAFKAAIYSGAGIGYKEYMEFTTEETEVFWSTMNEVQNERGGS